METAVKQRILGIVVLFSLIGICLSVLLHKNENTRYRGGPAMASNIVIPPPKQETFMPNATGSNSAPSLSMAPKNNIPSTTNNNIQRNTTQYGLNPINAQSNIKTVVNPTNHSFNFNDTSASNANKMSTLSKPAASTKSEANNTQQNLANSLDFSKNSTIAAGQTLPTINSAPALTGTMTQKQASTAKNLSPTPSINSRQLLTTPTTQNIQAASTAVSLKVVPQGRGNNRVDARPQRAMISHLSDADLKVPSHLATVPASLIESNFTHKNTHKINTQPIENSAHESSFLHPRSAAIKNVNSLPLHHSKNKSHFAENPATDRVVQVGSFSLPANAETLATSLREKGFSAVTQKITTAQGNMIRVIVGKSGMDKVQAQQLNAQLEGRMHLNGFITTRQPQVMNAHKTTAHKQVSTSHPSAIIIEQGNN